MSRIHLFEFEDQKWFPRFLRDYGTDFLQFLSNKTKMYKPIVPLLEKGLKASGTSQIIDLGSGGGGGLIWLRSALKKKIKDLQIILTDFYPNISAFKHTLKQSENFDFIKTPIDARKLPKNLTGIRTLFLVFHHFKPDDAKQILQNAVDSKKGIAIFEGQERSLKSLLAMFFSPLSVLFVTPFIKPFKTGRLLFTYIIPIVPLFVWWDGMVSSLRTYSVKEMYSLVDQLDNKDSFNWEIGRLKSGPGAILYLLGTYKNEK